MKFLKYAPCQRLAINMSSCSYLGHPWLRGDAADSPEDPAPTEWQGMQMSGFPAPEAEHGDRS
jgi:hypothetical protein